MVDFNKVSQAVQQEIKTISGMGGNKKKIDSADEFAALQQLGQRLETTGSASEKEYVAGLMVEYQNQVAADDAKAAEKRQKAEVTPAAREVVKNLKKIMPNKKELDEPEARMLLDLIKNTRGDFNAADIEYFKQELIKAGFGELLNEIEDKTKTEPEQAEPEQPKPEQAKPATPDTPSEQQPPKIEDEAGEQTKPVMDEPSKTETPVAGGGKPVKSNPPKNHNPHVPPKGSFDPGKQTEAPRTQNPVPGKTMPVKPKPEPKKGDGLRFKKEDVPNRAHLIVESSNRWFGTGERTFIDNVTVGAKRDKSGSRIEDKYLHGRQPLNAAEARAIDAELRQMTGKGLLQHMSEEFKIGGGDANDQFITQLYRQYITYGLKQ